MENTAMKAVLGAALRDIGKVIQRAGMDAGSSDKSMRSFWKEQAGISDNDVLDCIPFARKEDLSKADLKDNSPAWIVYIAERIASLAARDVHVAAGKTDQSVFKPLRPVFNRLNGNQSSFRYPAEGFHPDRINYPVMEESLFSKEIYREIAAHLLDDLKDCRTDIKYLDFLFSAMESSLSGIPSSTESDETADISVFDHLKLSAAIAACIHEYMRDKGLDNYREHLFLQEEEFLQEEAFLMASMDISGIQKFIYTIHSENALRSLRARSFYLEILMEHTIDELFDRLGLFRGNLLYSGGGHCYLLLPNTDKTKKQFDEFLRTLNEWFLAYFQTSLFIAGAYAACSAAALSNDPKGSYGAIFSSLSGGLSKMKFARYSAKQIMALNARQFNDYERECVVCKTLGNIDEDGRCPICSALEAFSTKVLYTDYFQVNRADPEEKTRTARLILPNGCVLRSADKDNLINQTGNGVRVYGKNLSFADRRLASRILVGDYTTGSSFQEFAESAKGIQRIGILRADVDNLGSAFVSGFKNPKNDDRFVTITRTAALSRQLSAFFKLYINEVIGSPSFTLDGSIKEKRNATVVYSGGDDLFIVGAWNEVIELAVDIRRAFERYSEGTLTLSAGIGIYDSGYPISAAADEVEDQVERSKAMPGKASLTLFEDGSFHREKDNGAEHLVSDGTYKWQEFEDQVVGEKLNLIADFFKDTGERGNSFLYRLLELIRIQEERINFARLVYLLARMEPDGNQDDGKKESYRRFSDSMVKWALNEKDRRQLKTAIQIFVYLNREKEGE